MSAIGRPSGSRWAAGVIKVVGVVCLVASTIGLVVGGYALTQPDAHGGAVYVVAVLAYGVVGTIMGVGLLSLARAVVSGRRWALALSAFLLGLIGLAIVPQAVAWLVRGENLVLAVVGLALAVPSIGAAARLGTQARAS